VDGVVRGLDTIITASWTNSPNFEQFEIARYDISVSSTSGVQMMAMANGTSTNITLTVNENPSNVEQTTTFTMTIAAINLCWETGSVATASYVLEIDTQTETCKYFLSLVSEATKVCMVAILLYAITILLGYVPNVRLTNKKVG